jgi:hypothetical protein
VESPSENAHANLVVETFEGDVIIVTVAALPTEYGETLDSDVQSDECAGAPPDDWVTQKINLTVMLAPEVDTAA